MKVHEKIKLARLGAGASQVKAAKALGVARQTYVDLETGKTQPRIDTLELMCTLFSVPFCYWSSKYEAGGLEVFTELQLINELRMRAELGLRAKLSGK